MKSPSQLKEEFDLTSMRLIGVQEEVRMKIAEGQRYFERIAELRQLIKEAELKQ